MFLYIFMGGLAALALFGVYQVLETRTVCVSLQSAVLFGILVYQCKCNKVLSYLQQQME